MRSLPKQFKSWLDFYRQVQHLEEQLEDKPDGGIILVEKPMIPIIDYRESNMNEENHEEFTFLEIKTQVIKEILSEPIMSKKQVILFYHGLLKMEHDAGYRRQEPDKEFIKVKDILLKLSDYVEP